MQLVSTELKIEPKHLAQVHSALQTNQSPGIKQGKSRVEKGLEE